MKSMPIVAQPLAQNHCAANSGKMNMTVKFGSVALALIGLFCWTGVGWMIAIVLAGANPARLVPANPVVIVNW
jgi:hypothetical protein